MFGWLRKRKQRKAARVAVDESRPVPFVDVYGRTLEIPLGRWRDDVLLPNIREAWADPAQLYSLVMDGVRKQLFDAVDEASLHLSRIDPLVERGHVVRAIVQMKRGFLDEAQATLHAAIARAGESGVLLTNEAKVIAERGDHAGSMAMLDRALRLDPNQDNGLGWRVAALQEDRDDAEVGTYLQALAALPHAWRPQLLLGRRALDAGHRDEALVLFREVLDRAAHETDVMLGVSGELGKHGFIADAVGLVAPLYDEKRDDPRAGFNLLQAYLELGDAEAGTVLLEKMFALRHPVYAERLQWYASAFDEMVRMAPRPLTEEPRIDVLRFDLPPWLLAMQDMAWAAPARDENAPRVVLLPLAALAHDGITQASSGREDERGRLSRALPLLLLEQLVFCSDLRAALHLPVANGYHLVLFGAPVADDELERLADDHDFAVEGDIVEQEDGFEIVCRLRNLADRSVLARVTRRFVSDEAGDALIGLTGELIMALGERTGRVIEPRSAHYALPQAHATPYVSALGQTLALTLARTTEARESLHGERNIYGWMQTLALALPNNEAAQFMYVTALAKGRRVGSPIVDEFEEPAVQRMREIRDAGLYATHLLPLLAAVFPSNDALFDMLAMAPASHEPAYAAWCARVAAAFPVVPEPPAG
ncbi:MAG: Beta-barrel assembly-enhancing protease [Luteibacter sp.]|uniref:hypothetical protein n=1 Tax=Luteibacter sp. TaxID=1886636 RepID=UPI001382DB6B|nr:hypothetical protein [Luteibacter sp.]KAF1005832.1 MAG: Beta-barrel assembly-enhancing protease [Luteibacter sp.]